MRAICLHPRRTTALVLLAASVHACSSDSATGPDDVVPASLGQVLEEAFAPTIVGIGGSFIPTLAPVPSTSLVSPSNCSYDAASRSFVCARFTAAQGLTIDRSFTLYDAAGNTQSQFSSTSTAAVRTKTHVAGTLTHPGGSFTTDVVDDRTVSGLLTSRHVLNGSGTSRMDGTMTGGGAPPIPLSSTSVTTIDGLVLPSAIRRWPGPGTMTLDETSSFGTFPATSSRLRVVFDGTKCVTLTTSFGDVSETRRIDLSNPGVMGCTP